jgi:hypothetical protein
MGRVKGRRYASTARAAEQLGISVPALRARIRRGNVPARKFGRDWGVLQSWLDLQTSERR